MTYRELIELYKTGKLNDEQKKQVEFDIERQDAISEYLYEQDEFSLLPSVELPSSEENLPSQETLQESEKFTKMIKSTIRKTFIKMGVITGSVILVIVFFVIFALPQIVDKLYYDPSETVGEIYGFETNRLSLDMAVYSELFLPDKYRVVAHVEELGYGKYDIIIEQNVSINGIFTDCVGSIDKGTIRLYNTNLLKRPAIDSFLPNNELVEDLFSMGEYEPSKEDSIATLEKLNPQDYYTAYFTLSEVMDYETLSNWAENNQISVEWCCLCFYDNPYSGDSPESADFYTDDVIGFKYASSSHNIGFDKEKYPLLTYFSLSELVSQSDGFDPEGSWTAPEEAMKQHVLSMFHFMADETEFCEMMEMENSKKYFQGLASNVKEHGLNIYGFTVTAQKDTILEICKQDKISYVTTSPVQ